MNMYTVRGESERKDENRSRQENDGRGRKRSDIYTEDSIHLGKCGQKDLGIKKRERTQEEARKSVCVCLCEHLRML